MGCGTTRTVASDSPAIWWAQWVLRFAVAALCVGAAVESWRSPVVGTMLVESWHIDPAAAGRVDAWAGWLLLIAAPLALLYPCGPVLLPVAGWLLAVSVAKMMHSGPFWELQLAAHAARYLAPLGLVLLVRWPRRTIITTRRLSFMEWTLRIAAALTFGAHGLQCIGADPDFARILIGTRGLLGGGIDEQTLARVLPAIGVVDLLLAVAVLMGRFRFFAVCMAGWGITAALSRMTGGGWSEYPATLIRLVNGATPLALVLYWQAGRRTEVVDQRAAKPATGAVEQPLD